MCIREYCKFMHISLHSMYYYNYRELSVCKRKNLKEAIEREKKVHSYQSHCKLQIDRLQCGFIFVTIAPHDTCLIATINRSFEIQNCSYILRPRHDHITQT